MKLLSEQAQAKRNVRSSCDEVPVAQLVRASVCGTESRGFNSHRAPHLTVSRVRQFLFNDFFE